MKSPEIENIIKAFTGRDRIKTIKGNSCMFSELVNKPHVMEFKDELSKKEYAISGLCQSCQDDTFG